MTLKKLLLKSRDYLKNLFLCEVSTYKKIFYVVEPANWVIKQEGKYIVDNINKNNFVSSFITTTYYGIRNQIIHFGSINSFYKYNKLAPLHRTNKIILTWYHVIPNDKRIELILKNLTSIDILHTSSTITYQSLINLGFPASKIVMIPLGVDLNLFKPMPDKARQEIKEKLGLPNDSVIIGSFQKDGQGWGEGNIPKLIKGPDILIEVLRMLAKDFNIFVLLTGPARGFVKNELKKLNIPYVHFCPNYKKIPLFYNCLDLYIVCSRIEGGPKALLECMACGVPLVSTSVGMAKDLIKNGINGFIVESENINQIVNKSKMILQNNQMKNEIIKNAQVTIQKYDWPSIAKEYLEKLYLPL